MVMLAKATEENKEEDEACGLTVCEATEPGRGGGVSWAGQARRNEVLPEGFCGRKNRDADETT